MEDSNKKGKMVIVAAPSGAGKTTIVHALLDHFPNDISFSVSACNRNPRSHETEGVDYYFLSTEAFKQKVKDGAFIEWEEVYENNFYGTLREEIERIWTSGKTVIFDVDVQGAINIKKQYPDNSLSVFIEPPSIETLEKRLTKRKTESKESLNRRLKKAASELKFREQFDVCILNDNLEVAKRQAYQIVNDFLNSN